MLAVPATGDYVGIGVTVIAAVARLAIIFDALERAVAGDGGRHFGDRQTTSLNTNRRKTPFRERSMI